MPREVSPGRFSNLLSNTDGRLHASNSAFYMGYTLNIAIGLQVLLGALTMGLAATLNTGRQVSFISELF